jgi:hypothetical protein
MKPQALHLLLSQDPNEIIGDLPFLATAIRQYETCRPRSNLGREHLPHEDKGPLSRPR